MSKEKEVLDLIEDKKEERIEKIIKSYNREMNEYGY